MGFWDLFGPPPPTWEELKAERERKLIEARWAICREFGRPAPGVWIRKPKKKHAVPLSGIERLMELSPHNFEADPGLQLSWDNVLGKSHFRPPRFDDYVPPTPSLNSRISNSAASLMSAASSLFLEPETPAPVASGPPVLYACPRPRKTAPKPKPDPASYTGLQKLPYDILQPLVRLIAGSVEPGRERRALLRTLSMVGRCISSAALVELNRSAYLDTPAVAERFHREYVRGDFVSAIRNITFASPVDYDLMADILAPLRRLDHLHLALAPTDGARDDDWSLAQSKSPYPRGFPTVKRMTVNCAGGITLDALDFFRTVIAWWPASAECAVNIYRGGGADGSNPKRISLAVRTFAPIVTKLRLAGTIPLCVFDSAPAYPRLEYLMLVAPQITRDIYHADGRVEVEKMATESPTSIASLGGCPRLTFLWLAGPMLVWGPQLVDILAARAAGIHDDLCTPISIQLAHEAEIIGGESEDADEEHALAVFAAAEDAGCPLTIDEPKV